MMRSVIVVVMTVVMLYQRSNRVNEALKMTRWRTSFTMVLMVSASAFGLTMNQNIMFTMFTNQIA